MIPGVGVVLVHHSFFLQLVVQCSRSLFEAVIVVLSAVEIDGHLSQCSSVLLGQDKRAIIFPVGNVDRVPENGSQRFSERRAGPVGRVEFLRRFGNQRGALRADCGK